MKSQILSEECKVAQVAGLLSDAWTILVIRDLSRSSKRFSELELSLAGISTRTLTLKLKRLEELGVVSHIDTHYKLTSEGKKIIPVISEMEKCGKKLKIGLKV